MMGGMVEEGVMSQATVSSSSVPEQLLEDEEGVLPQGKRRPEGKLW